MTLSWRASLDPSMKEPIVRIQMPLQGSTESREAWKQVKPTERHVASGNQYRSRPEGKGLRSQVLAEAHSPTMALCQVEASQRPALSRSLFWDPNSFFLGKIGNAQPWLINTCTAKGKMAVGPAFLWPGLSSALVGMMAFKLPKCP